MAIRALSRQEFDCWHLAQSTLAGLTHQAVAWFADASVDLFGVISSTALRTAGPLWSSDRRTAVGFAVWISRAVFMTRAPHPTACLRTWRPPPPRSIQSPSGQMRHGI
jgi:hypothetical protein